MKSALVTAAVLSMLVITGCSNAPATINASKTALVYFKNCSAARAAGAAPVYRGDPGYASHLDRDGDGVGCE